MSDTVGLLTYDARHQRWRAMVGQWRCSYCACRDNTRTILNPVCARCKHIHLLPAQERALHAAGTRPPVGGTTQQAQLPLLEPGGDAHE